MKNKIHLILLLLASSLVVKAQKEKVVEEHFRSTRIINLHSVESLRAGDLEFKISHRFGEFSSGVNQFWGLDQAQIRLALEYGLTENFMFGVGRSSQGKIVDGFAKYRILTQKKNGSPLSISYLASTAVSTFPDREDRERNLTQRLSFANQIIFSSKLHERFALQLSPTLVHQNLVASPEDQNTSFAIGISSKYNLTKVLSLNGEFIPRLSGFDTPSFKENHNSLSIGMGINTRGHFFEFHLTNSFPMIEQGFITQTTGNWADGNIHLGFNIVRDFRIHRPKKK